MKISLRIAAAMFAAALAIGGMTSCGDSAAKQQQQLEQSAATIDSLFEANAAGKAFSQVDVNVAEAGVDVKIVLGDSLIHVDLLGNDLLDYFLARQLKQVSADDFNRAFTVLKAPELLLNLAITDAFGGVKIVQYSSDKLLNLRKAKASQLNASEAARQVVALLETSLPSCQFVTDNASSTSLRLDHKFLTYNVKFPKDKFYSQNGQGFITGLYMANLQKIYGSPDAFRAAVIDTFKDLGIEGVRIEFSADGSEKVLKQAFPWRTLLEP